MTRRNIRIAAAYFVLCAPLPATVRGQGVNEDELFGDTAMIVDSATLVDNTSIRESAADRKTIGVSGDITGSGTATAMRDWFDADGGRFRGSDTRLASSVVGTMFLDARLPAAIKGFGAMEARYAPDSGAAFELSELFVDANYKKRVYVRVGKQVLQWGRCYFFNPTDLINIEKKSFLLKLGAREGAFGCRVHIPFGTRFNLYGFLDTRGAARPDQVAGAAKAEVLAGGTEMAVGLWGRRTAVPVYSFDISTTIADFIIAGEMALSHGDNLGRLVEENGTLYNRTAPEKWTPRAAVGVTRFFDFLDIDDRIMAIAEFYYNHGGYDKSIFNDSANYAYSEPVTMNVDGPGPVTLSQGYKAVFFILNNLYEMNNYGKYYAALFTSIRRFIVQDMTLTLNALSNIAEPSFIVSGGLSYKTLHDFSLGLTVNGFLGRDYTEYTFLNNALSVQLTAGIAF